MKHFDEGSDWGLRHGCISKLWIADENGTVANFDRGWDVRPATAEAKAVFAALAARFNRPSADKAGASL